MMRRVTDYHDLMFPVRTVRVFAELCEGVESSRRRIPGKKAIVDCTSDRVISVVNDEYQIVTNRQALEYAHQCCAAAFPDLPSESWIVGAADGPLTGGHCRIDLTHTTAQIRFDRVAPGSRPEVYGPFVRVTNSYNRTKALGFDIGFMRKVCGNGMILPQSSVRFSFDHNTRHVADRIRFQTSRSQFRDLKAKFVDFLEPLQKRTVPQDQFLPITLLAMRVRNPENLSGRRKQVWADLKVRIKSLAEKYVQEIGANGYALMNVISDLASRPVEALNRRERHSLQKLAGEWLGAFSAECRKDPFDLPRYMKGLEQAVQGSRGAASTGPSSA